MDDSLKRHNGRIFLLTNRPAYSHKDARTHLEMKIHLLEVWQVVDYERAENKGKDGDESENSVRRDVVDAIVIVVTERDPMLGRIQVGLVQTQQIIRFFLHFLRRPLAPIVRFRAETLCLLKTKQKRFFDATKYLNKRACPSVHLYSNNGKVTDLKPAASNIAYRASKAM